MLTLGPMGSKCLWDNLHSIFGEVSSPNFRQEKRCGRGCSAVDKGTCPVTRLTRSYRDWIELVGVAFSISGLATRSQALHAGNHFPSTPWKIVRTLSPAHSSESPGRYTYPCPASGLNA